MIDIENDVYDAISTVLKASYPGITVTGEYVPTNAKLPAVSIVEADNRVVDSMRTVHIENAAHVMYEVNVYTNLVNGKKTQAKNICSTLDDKFAEMGFTRTMRNQVPNFANTNIYRIVCRYEANVDPDFWIYQN